MIVTCKKHIPKHWIFLSILPWAATTFKEGVMGTALIFSFKKFVDNPAGLTLILSLPWIISIVNAPICSFLSDRVWTRIGRRKPFILIGLCGTIPCLFLMPLMPSLWALIALYMVHGVFADFNGPLEPLKQEIIPPHQRGGATAAMIWCSNIANITFYFVALGRFDDVTFMAGFPITGETAIFWTSSLMGCAVLTIIALGIKEVNQHSALRGERFSPRTFLRGITSSEIWPVYVLIFGAAMLNAGLGPLGNLLYTEQWGYSKQDMGVNIAIGGVLNIFLIGALGMIANRLDRVRAYRFLLYVILGLNVCYYLYIKLVLPDHRPSLVEMVVFGELITVALILASVLYTPLVYDFIRRNQMGTYAAGAGIVYRLTSVLTVNGLGLFVWVYAILFLAPAGDRTRVFLRDTLPQSTVEGVLNETTWRLPQEGAAAPTLWVGPWNAMGTTLADNHCWEIRLPNKDSEKLAERRADLKNKSSVATSELQLLTNKADSRKKAGEPEDSGLAREINEQNVRITRLADEIRTIDDQLRARSDEFGKQVKQALGDRMLVDGEQIIAAGSRVAVLMELPLAKRPDSARLEKILNRVRGECRPVIDMRPIQSDAGYRLQVSVLVEPGADENAVVKTVRDTLLRIAERRDQGLFAPDAHTVTNFSPQQAMAITLRVVEEPLNLHVSPITRVVNLILGWFDNKPGPEDRINGLARSLRLAGSSEFVRVHAGEQGQRTISVIAVLNPEAAKAEVPDDLVERRLASLLGPQSDAGGITRLRAFYDRIVTAGAVQRLTVAQPFILSAYAPLQYDYTSGYLWMFLLGILGITIITLFLKKVKAGKIRRLGLEEAEGATATTRPSAYHPDGPTQSGGALDEHDPKSPGLYVPGRAPFKLALIAVGLAIFGFGLIQIWTPLRLLATGVSVTAESTRIIKTKAGLPDVVFTNDAAVSVGRDAKDHSFRYWNEFRFRTQEDREITLLCPIAGQVKPLYPLLRSDGLPTTLPVHYDAAHPESVVFPTVISTWFIPGILVFLGLAWTVIGSLLFYWAKKPISLPHIP